VKSSPGATSSLLIAGPNLPSGSMPVNMPRPGIPAGPAGMPTVGPLGFTPMLQPLAPNAFSLADARAGGRWMRACRSEAQA